LRLWYTFGLSANAVLTRRVEPLLQQALAAYEQERQTARQEERLAQPVRLFVGFWYQAGTWEQARYVVAKVEVNDKGINRRFVVSNRPGAALLPGPTYDEYAERGESENRNKEIKCGLEMDRLSDERFCANYFRLYLHALAMNLLVRLRRQIAESDPLEGSGDVPVPVEAQTGAERQRRFRRRRQRDPLGEGQPCTWRLLVIKVAAEVVVSARRILVRLSSSWPHLEWYRRVCERLRRRPEVATSG
jgi:DDE family transposase